LANGTPYTFTVHAANSAGNGPESAASNTVTPTLPTPTLTSISPATVPFTGRETQTFILTGTNFASDSVLEYNGPTTSATLNASYAWVSSTRINMSVTIDPTHYAYGSFPFQVCKADGVSCSGSLPVVFYGKTMCGVLASGETVCGNSLNGNADFFAPVTGAFERSVSGVFGLISCGVVADPLTGYWTNDIEPLGLDGQQSLTAPNLTGGYGSACVANAAGNGFIAALDTTSGLTYGSWVGAHVNEPVIQAFVGSNPQSVAVGVYNGKTWAIVFDASTTTGTPAIGNVNMTDGKTQTTTSWPTVGITAGAPAKSWMAVFDSLGRGVIASGNVANVFGESDMKPITTFGSGGIISLPAGNTVISIIPVGNYAVIGSWNGTLGTFIKLDPSTGNVALLSFTVSFAPIGIFPIGTTGFRACQQDESSACSSFTLP